MIEAAMIEASIDESEPDARVERIDVERIRAFLLRVQRESGVPGIALALGVGGRRVSIAVGARAAGDREPLPEDPRFHLGCTTKLLLAAVTLELALSGTVDLGAPLAEYLPELAPTVHGQSVRVSHLLSHTSGYRGTNIFERGTRDLGWDALVDYLRRAPQLFAPGSVFNYEHTESVLLGRVLERVTGARCLTLIADRILDPLGVGLGRLADFEHDPRSAGRNELDPRSQRFVPIRGGAELPELWEPAFSSLTVSLCDLAHIGEALLAPPARRVDGAASCIGEETRRRLLRPVVRLPAALGGPLRESLPVAFGLGAARLVGGLAGNNGLSAGQCVALRVDPATGLAAAVGLNAMLPPLRDFILSAVLAEIAGQRSEITGRRAENRGRPAADAALAELPGRYLGPGSAVLSAALHEDRLALELETDGAASTFIGELVTDDDGALVLSSPMPQLALGVFREPESGAPALMLGLNAYKRAQPSA